MSTSRQTGPANPRARHTTGRAAEDFAAAWLERQGCFVVARRYGKRGGEIDLVIDDAGVVAFVEVKARRSDRFGVPIATVTARKRARIIATARTFLGERRWRSRPCRFDVVGVRLEGGKARIEWFRDAFRA
jgi:putative endonuclease